MGHFSRLPRRGRGAHSPAQARARPRRSHSRGFCGAEAHLPQTHTRTALPGSQNKGLSSFSHFHPFKCCSFSHTTWGHGAAAAPRAEGLGTQGSSASFNSKFEHRHTKNPTKPPLPCSKPPPKCSFHCALSYLASIEKHMFALCPELLQHLLTDQ